MIGLWKRFRVNLMYWRFRHVTRNRLRFQAWYRQRRRPPSYGYRPRGGAAHVYRRSGKRVWIILLATVGVLTALRVLSFHVSVGGGLVYLLSALVIIAAIYWAMRGV